MGLPQRSRGLGARVHHEFYAQEIFDRFGDGPISGQVTGLSTADSVLPGDFIKITLPSYPNPASTTGRGTTRLAQVMERVDEPGGLGFTYLDLGPDSNALAAPAFSILRSTVTPKHECTVTVTSLPTTNAKWQLRWAQTATSESAPSSDSDLWTLGRFAGAQLSTGSVTLSQLASGKSIHIETRGISRSRIRSAWSTAKSTTMEALETSTFVGQVGTFASYVIPDWTVGTTEYPLEMYLDRSTTASFDSSNFAVALPPGNSPEGGTTDHGLVFENLTTADDQPLQTENLLFGVRHIDAFGGVGAIESTVLTLSTTAVIATLPAMRGINIQFGNNIL